jgi:DNA-binding response OmpR family regulator
MSHVLSLLLVEDDFSLREELTIFLKDFFEDIEVAADAYQAMAWYEKRAFDVVLSDIRLPGQNGLGLIEKIQKKNPKQIVIVMSAYKEVDYFIKSIELKVYGFLTKPFDSQKLISIMLKLTSELHNAKESISVSSSIELSSHVYFDTQTKLLHVNGVMQELTLKEEQLLLLLAKQPNYFISNELLCETLWGQSDVSSSTLRALVKRLRDKLGYEESITNLKGRGYRLNVHSSLHAL